MRVFIIVIILSVLFLLGREGVHSLSVKKENEHVEKSKIKERRILSWSDLDDKKRSSPNHFCEKSEAICKALEKEEEGLYENLLRDWAYDDIEAVLSWVSRNEYLENVDILSIIIDLGLSVSLTPKEALVKVEKIKSFRPVYVKVKQLQFERWLHENSEQAESWMVTHLNEVHAHEHVYDVMGSYVKHVYRQEGGEGSLQKRGLFEKYYSLQEHFIGFLYETWVNHSPNEFGEWLKGSSESRNKDLGLFVYVKEIASFDAQIAMLWADLISNSHIKSYAQGYVGKYL